MGCTLTYDSLKLCRVVGSVAVVHITLPTENETNNSYSIITTQTPTKLNNSGYVCVLYPHLFCFETITLWITLCCIFLFILFRWSPKMTLPGSGTSFMKPGSVAIKSPTNRLGNFPLLTTYSSNI